MQQRRMEASQGCVFEHVAAMSNKGSHSTEEPEAQCRPSLGDYPHWGYSPSVTGQGLPPSDLTASAPPTASPVGQRRPGGQSRQHTEAQGLRH